MIIITRNNPRVQYLLNSVSNFKILWLTCFFHRTLVWCIASHYSLRRDNSLCVKSCKEYKRSVTISIHVTKSVLHLLGMYWQFYQSFQRDCVWKKVALRKHFKLQSYLKTINMWWKIVIVHSIVIFLNCIFCSLLKCTELLNSSGVCLIPTLILIPNLIPNCQTRVLGAPS